jgi:hypothetical protein
VEREPAGYQKPRSAVDARYARACRARRADSGAVVISVSATPPIAGDDNNPRGTAV